jgi:hypothetical protein
MYVAKMMDFAPRCLWLIDLKIGRDIEQGREWRVKVPLLALRDKDCAPIIGWAASVRLNFSAASTVEIM